MRVLFDGLVSAVGWPLRMAGGISVAMLPSRLWPRLDRWVPATACAAPAALLTIFAAFALGFPGFLRYATEQASANTALMLKAAERQVAGQARGEAPITVGMPVGIAGLTLFTFLLFTPTGWGTIYLAATGTMRAVSAATGDPFGDPILTGIDAGVRRVACSARARRARRRREALEGPEVPDRAFRGPAAGFPTADLVIVAARRKPDWTPGTVVITHDQWYRIGEPVERTLPQGLRTLYPLTRHADLEVLRRGVHYALPRVEAGDLRGR